MDVSTLKTACDAVIADPKLQPIRDPNTGKIIQTFCNLAAMRVAHACGCDELQGLMADEMYTVMNDNASGKWIKVGGPMAAAAAQQGKLVFAAMSSAMLGESHGHIAACYPAPMVASARLGRRVPAIANIGQKNAVEGENWAFPVSKCEPDYFCYDG